MVAASPETDAGSDCLLFGHYRALSTYYVLSRSLGTKVYPPIGIGLFMLQQSP
jgi:hypothetical protein